MGKSGSGGEDDVDAAGKYLLISVPQFAKDPISGNLMTSYLRLGAASTTQDKDPGGWLANMIQRGGPPGGHLSPAGADVDSTGEDPKPVFSDDLRDRVPGTGHQLTTKEREEESSIIHTRGGWRDHSDGNRISTTYGDKIEVIRGNYKLMILGRQDDPAQSVGLDASSLLMEDYGSQSSGVRIEESSIYTDEQGNNVWHFQESCEGCVLSENFAGDHYEFAWGKRFESTTGSESPTEKGPHGYPRQNPHIVEKTWAKQIESYTGSAALPVPETLDMTFVGTQVEVLNAGLITSTTTCAGAITETTAAAVANDISVIGQINENTTAALGIASLTTAGMVTEITNVAGVSTSIETVGASKVDVTTAGTILETTVAAAKAEIGIVGAAVDIDICVAKAEVDLSVLAIELSLALKLAVEISAKIEIFLGAKLELHADASTNIGTEGIEVTGTKSLTTGAYKLEAATINLN